MTNTIRIGAMPGRIQEYVLEEGTTVNEALEVAGLNADGFEVKLDGSSTDNLNQSIDGVNVLLLTKKVKGNTYTSIKIGRSAEDVEEYVFEADTTVEEALEVAGLDSDGWNIELDGNQAELSDDINGCQTLYLRPFDVVEPATEQVIRIGAMPGRIQEYVLASGTTVNEALEVAGLNADGFEVKLDGSSTDNLNQTIDGVNVLLLTKKVKGN